MAQHDIDQILDKLAKDVAAAVHALYRGEMRQATANVRTGHLVREAREALDTAIGGAVLSAGGVAASGEPSWGPGRGSPRPSVAAPTIAGLALGWSTEESNAVLKCIMAWLPVGGPASTAPDSRCIAAGKMLVPTWGEREKALAAVRKSG